MTILSKTQENSKALKKRIEIFIKRFKVNGILRSIGATKVKGISAYLLFSFLFELVFTKKNLNQQMTTKKESLSPSNFEIPFEKNAVYRFLDRGNVHWEGIVKELAFSVIPEVSKLTSKERKIAFIIDDTPFYRDRSSKVEMLAWHRDHSANRYYKGFNMLNMGWSDGQTFVPVDFRLLSAGINKELLCESKVAEDHRTLATRRRTDARKEKPALVLEMLKSVRYSAIDAQYVLFDSWFCNPSSLLDIKRLGYDVVAQMKDTKTHHYLYEGQCMPIRQIFKMSPKRRGRSRYLLSVTVDIRHNDYAETVPAKIVFVRNRNNRKKWIAIISTDTSLTEDEIIALYGKRWDIEPYHKMLKSGLHLAKELQLRSFDSIVAHTAIVVARYIFLALENRESKDERTMGALFLVICDELVDISFSQALTLLMSALESYLAERLGIAKDLISEAISCFLASLPACFKDWAVWALCES
jgi:hypothetical protein